MQNTTKKLPKRRCKPTKNGYNPFLIHRKVRRTNALPDGIVQHKTLSFTNRTDEYHPQVDCVTGDVWCDCPDFLNRCSHREQNALNLEDGCKHCRRAVERRIKDGELDLDAVRLRQQPTRRFNREFDKTMSEMTPEENAAMRCAF